MKEYCEIKEAPKLVDVRDARDAMETAERPRTQTEVTVHSSAVSGLSYAPVDCVQSFSTPSNETALCSTVSHKKPTLGQNLAQRLAISSIVIGSLMTYLVIYLLSGHLFWHITGVQTNDYIYSTLNACGIGLVLTAACYMEFLHRFADLKNNVFSLLAGLAAAIFVCCTLTDGLQGVWVTSACCIAALVTGKLAQQARQAIPPTFRYHRAILVSALASLPAALISVGIFASAAADTSTAPVVFAPGACGEEIAAALALFIFLTIPAYALARCARTSEAKPLIALGFLQISPLLIGVFAQLILLSSTVNALPLGISGLTALGFVTVCVAWGSSAGALVNGMRHKRKMSKAI